MSFSFFFLPPHIPVPRWIFSLESSIIQQAILVRNIPFLCLWNYSWRTLWVDSSYLGDRGRPYVTLGVVQFLADISCWGFLKAVLILVLVGYRAGEVLLVLSLPPSWCPGHKKGGGTQICWFWSPNWRTSLFCSASVVRIQGKTARNPLSLVNGGVYVPVIYDHSLKSRFKKSSQAQASFQEMTDTYSLLIQALFSSPQFLAISDHWISEITFFFCY